jgi:hypothetical protein
VGEYIASNIISIHPRSKNEFGYWPDASGIFSDFEIAPKLFIFRIGMLL